MKIVFLGTPKFAVPTLEMLIKHHEVLLVVTQPDKPIGRKKVMTASPVKEVALKYGIEVFQPNKLRKDYQKILDLKPDLLITAAYGQMLPKGLIDPIVSMNVHGSLLPKYRGGAPIQYALFNGDEQTGVTIMYMAYQMDSGDMIKQASIDILEDDNCETLTKKLSSLGAYLLENVLDDYAANIKERMVQDESQVTFAYTIKYEDEKIDFTMSAKDIVNKIKGLYPEPGVHFDYLGQSIKIYQAKKSDIIVKNAEPGQIILTKKHLLIQAKDGVVDILELQIPGKKRMKAPVYLNGQTLFNEGDIIKEGENNE
ncbi:MAG: methionyl-tRNA formyltransferase [Acholeplasmataceae bacterium]